MNDVLDPAPLFIRESLIVGLESLDVGAVVTVLRLVIESHGFDHAADDSVGPAAQFALDAEPGDRVGFLDQGIGFTPDHPHDWTLLIGDETALPAIAGICRSLPETARGVAIIEIPTAGDRQEFPSPAGMEITWIHRDEAPAASDRPGELALCALMTATLPDGEVHAHAIGESALATGARRHLVGERDVSKRNIDFVGYWRHGRAATG